MGGRFIHLKRLGMFLRRFGWLVDLIVCTASISLLELNSGIENRRQRHATILLQGVYHINNSARLANEVTRQKWTSECLEDKSLPHLATRQIVASKITETNCSWWIEPKCGKPLKVMAILRKRSEIYSGFLFGVSTGNKRITLAESRTTPIYLR